ncbi:MAG: aminopeptidase N [Actinomycetota bacterium]
MTTAGKDNLTRAEAQGRARLISSDVAYAVKLGLRVGDVTFDSETTVAFACSEPGSSTFIDLDAVEVHEIELNGQSLPTSNFADGRVRLDNLAATNGLRIKATCEYARTGTGLHRFVDPVDKRVYAYTQFEPFDAHRVIACFDQPDIKGTFAYDVEVPEEWVVISNMRPMTRPEEGKAGHWVFEATPVMSTYLAALCVGPFHGVFDNHEDLELAWWCRQSLKQYLDPEELFLFTKQGFDFFHEMFDYRYMLDSYDQVMCPEYKFGAMENLGCVTYTERFIFRSKVTEAERERRAEVILHEMSHMWFGDLVTMKWWNDLWLNESFATYMAYLAKEKATRFTNSWVSFASDEKTWAYRQDQLPTTHPIVADIPDVEATHLNFDGITYAKGASVLKQLVAWVGQDAFFKGLRTYFKKHAHKNTELPDFLGPLAEESGRDLDSWSREWLETAGVNSVRVDYSADGEKISSFAIEQTAIPEYPAIRSHRMAVGLFDTKTDGLKLRKSIELDVVGPRTEVGDLAGEKVPDLILPNHLDLAYAKIRFDDRSLQTLTDRLRDLSDPLARTLCWNAAWDMLRDAELPARNYLDLVLNNVSGETDIGVVQDLVGRSGAAVNVYGDPSNRDPARAKLATKAKTQLDAAEAGSDVQLTWARAFIGAARSNEDVAFLKGLLDGSSSIDRLEVDTDLRWSIVSSLAATGNGDEELIAAEFERDPTDQGERHAVSARAARPTPEAKAEAWERITQDAELTLAMIRSLIGGFQIPFQDELLEPYADNYFQELLGFWERRDLDLGLAFVGGMYPDVYKQEVLDATDALLAKDDLPPPVRRLLLEQKDDTQRVMRARLIDR